VARTGMSIIGSWSAGCLIQYGTRAAYTSVTCAILWSLILLPVADGRQVLQRLLGFSRQS
jgi:hypothetical protein